MRGAIGSRAGVASLMIGIACAAAGCGTLVLGGGSSSGGDGPDLQATTTVSSGEGGASTTSSTSSGAGGGLGCTPASLVGINWTGSEHQVASLDPSTGALTVLGPAPEKNLLIGFSAYDPATKRVYEVCDGAIYAVDGVTGAVVYTTPLSAVTTNQIYNPEVNDAGDLVILRILGTSTGTAKLDPMTGAIVDLSTTPHSGGYGQALRAVDRGSNRIYQLGDGFVLTIDGATGVVLADVSLADQGFFNPQVNVAGEVIGVHVVNGVFHTAKLDPATAVITDLAPVPGGFDQGISTYDPCTNRMYQLAGFHVLTIDGSTGALLADVTMAQQNFLNVEAVW